MTHADETHREDMRSRLRLAADHFSLTLAGEPTFGWRDRTIGSRAKGPNGEYWLRASWAHAQWAEGNYWTGNQDASAIVGVPKPVVLGLHDWTEDGDRNRAETMTLVTDKPCSETHELREELDLPEQWWQSLRAALETLSTHNTERAITNQEKVTGRLLSFFGSAVDPVVTTWTTAHGDVNWTNLTAPNMNILDWESFGMAPAGYDAATLYCLSLLTPRTARKAHDTFSEILDSPDGIRSQLHVIGRYLKRVEYGDFVDLADVLHQHAHWLMTSKGR